MKKRLFILLAVLALGVVAGVFFADTKPRVPLVATITEITNQPGGGKIVYCLVSNQTSQSYRYFIMPQTITNGVWATTRPDSEKFDGVKTLGPHYETEQAVHTAHDTGLLRLRISYAPRHTAMQLRIDRGLRTLRLPAIFDRPNWKDITTPPTNFPAR